MKLYGTPPTRATKVLWVLRELGLNCEIIFVSLRRGDHRKAEFLALNPAGRLPVLVDGDLVLTESVAICLYLAETKCPNQRLIPRDAGDRAQMYRWLFFLVSEIEGALERFERHTSLYPEEQRLPAERDLALKDAREMCAVLDKHMEGRHYLVGERLTVADLICGYVLDWVREVKLLDEFPLLLEFRSVLYTLPSAPPTVAA